MLCARTLLIVSALLAGASDAKAAEALVDLSLTVDATKVSEQTLDRLVTEAYPIEYRIAQGETLRAAVERQCARTTPQLFAHLRSRFFELNPDVTVLAGRDVLDAQILNATTFLGPFCFRLPSGGKEPSATPVALWTRSNSAANPHYGVAGRDLGDFLAYSHTPTYSGLTNYQSDFNAWSPKHIAPQSDPTSLATTITLTRGEAQTTLAMLHPASAPSANAQIEDEENRGQLVVQTDVSDKPCVEAVDTTSPRAAEFDPEEILTALALNEYIRARVRSSRSAESFIHVADSGLFLNQSPVFADSRWGDYSPENEPQSSYVYASHGTQVSGLSLGGLQLTLANSLLLARKPRLAMYNIMTRRAVSGGFDYFVDEGKLLDALTAAQSTSTGIVNMSVRFPKPIPAFADLKKSSHVLIVVAAGNSGLDLDSHQAFPAKEGGSDNSVVVTVAAVERSGKIAPFSNRGASYVDIAALGCNVQTWDFDKVGARLTSTRVSGTSFAAPMVSAVAAWLKVQYPTFTALRLKHQIIRTADIVADLSGSVRHGRVLNPYKALRSIYADVVEIEDRHGRRLLTGRLTNPSGGSQWKIGGNDYNRQTLLKVARYKDEAEKFIVYKKKDSSSEMVDRQFISNLFGQTEVEIEDALTGKKERVATDSIRDIVFAAAPYWESPYWDKEKN